MTNNMELWDKLGRTDPSHVKAFKRAGGFSGTAIKPMWSYRRMTEEFGPCGKGWGVNEPSFQVVVAGDETLVYCTASIWYNSADESGPHTVYGVGGDKVVAKFSSGLKSDDEAFKKSFTDAVTNALKLIGVGADVHMGMFDDNKYVNTLKSEFSETPPAKSSAALKRAGSWEEIMKQFNEDIQDCKTLVTLESLKETYRVKVTKEGWTAAWKAALKDEFDKIEDQIMRELEKEEA